MINESVQKGYRFPVASLYEPTTPSTAALIYKIAIPKRLNFGDGYFVTLFSGTLGKPVFAR